MSTMMGLQRLVSSALIGWMLQALLVLSQFNNPPGVEIWCGKAYKSDNASFDPGGRFKMPQRSPIPLLDLRIYSRMNIYLGNEANGTFVIDAALSEFVGQPLCTGPSAREGYIQDDMVSLKYRIKRTDTGAVIANNVDVAYNSTGTRVDFELSGFKARMEPYEILLQSTTPKCGKTFEAFEARTQLMVLPPRTDGGSVTKLDRLYGGLLVQNETDDKRWDSIFPYSFYLDWGKYLEGNISNTKAFAELGYNIVHPTPGDGKVPFKPADFNRFLDVMEKETKLRLMYDMRWTYKDLQAVEEQVNRLKTRKSLLLWYTADEPDGNSDPLNSTKAAYDLIRRLDPYRPTSLVLNCQNFYYKEYTSGTDIVLTDPYPIAVNVSFSNRWNTVCNATYGDCGCDNCHHGGFQDVVDRMQTLDQYEDMLASEGLPARPLWGVPQAFGGSEYWARPPTGNEEEVMAALFINHGAKGLVAWNFPTTDELTKTTSKLAKTLTASGTTRLLLGAQPEKLAKIQGGENVDAAIWRAQGSNKTLVSVVHTGQETIKDVLTVELPVSAKNAKLVWPPNAENTWIVDGEFLSKPNVKPMEVSFISLDVE